MFKTSPRLLLAIIVLTGLVSLDEAHGQQPGVSRLKENIYGSTRGIGNPLEISGVDRKREREEDKCIYRIVTCSHLLLMVVLVREIFDFAVLIIMWCQMLLLQSS